MHFIGWVVTIIIILLLTAIWLFFYTLPAVKSFDSTVSQATELTKSRYTNTKNIYRWTKIDNINRDLIYSVVFAEDSRFFEHSGVDSDAIIDAAFRNIKLGEKSFGGSTITQQVAKNIYLTNEKTYLRKLREIALSLEIEKKFSKNEILELYLNIAEFGADLFGVDMASRWYFGKDPKRINAGEGAYMALMLPSPRKYQYTIHQNKNPSVAQKRKFRNILRAMYANGYINEQNYKKYLKLIAVEN